MPNKEQKFWLIRELGNMIRGPFKQQEVLNLLRKKQLKNKTEISRANSYWFAVEEKTELARFFPELGLEVPAEESQEHTQMTATLTQADADDREDVTTFVKSPEEITKAAGLPKNGNVARTEWLSEEMAEEFGDFDSFAVETPTQSKELNAPIEALPVEEEPTESLAAEDMLKRATVKADTLPSELKDFQGSRPKPINAIIRGPERAQAVSAIVQVPVEKPEAPANILSYEAEEAAAVKKKKRLIGALGILAALGLMVLGYTWMAKHPYAFSKARNGARAGKKSLLSPEQALRKALLLYDLEGTKDALTELEMGLDPKGKFQFSMAQALVKKEFLFDSEGALSHLLLARSLSSSEQSKAEVANLIALYSYDRDPGRAIEALRGLVRSSPSEPLYKYNLAIALLRFAKAPEALGVLGPLVAELSESDALFPEASFALGWAQELDTKSREQSEGAFLRALSVDPTFGKARLGLAIHRLRRSGFRAAEADFRAFIDLAPDLDPPSRVINFRKMEGAEFYGTARNWIRELNLDGPMGSRPSPLVMAVDAMLSCLQNRTGEAGKILETALSSSNGDLSVLKAMAYHRWKEGRYSEIVELLKDVPRENMGFSIPFITGKALVKLDRRGQAEKMFAIITQELPARSDGWAELGDSMLISGKKVEAKMQLTNAVRRDPDNLVALRALDRLGQQDIISDEIMGNLPF